MTKGIEMANQLTAAIASPAAPKHAATSGDTSQYRISSRNIRGFLPKRNIDEATGRMMST
jgi:hypothetical protein